MKPFLDRLRAGEVLIGDGAWGTMLMAAGLESGRCPESLNLDRPRLLEEIARKYVEAGAEIITTNTFGASPLKLALYGLQEKTEALNAAAVAAVRPAVGDRACVAGSIGPTGKLLKPYGDADPGEVLEGYRRQARALIDAGVDVINVETMTDLQEAKLAVGAAREAGGRVPIIACMTFDPTPRGFYTIMGVDIAAAAAGLADAGADVVGSNCGNGIEIMIEIARAFRKHTRLPLIAQANAGLPETHEGRLVYKETPAFFAERARELVAAGVSIVGGCCGTTPEHIREIRKAVGRPEVE